MAGTAHAAELIPCDRCNGHYVVDASSDGKPRVRCNKCGHLREATADTGPMSVPGKWTVIGPDGKAMSFDTWEELTESRRPHAIAANAKGMEEADKALKELSSKEAKKSASALLDVTPAPAPTPKLALADMDSALDLGEAIGNRKSRLSGPASSPQSSGKLEPLLVRSFHPQSQAPKSKVEWAPKIDAKSLPVPAPAAKSDMVPRGEHDNTLRVDLAPSHRLDAPITAKVIEAERPTAPNMSDGADSIDELDPDALLEDEDDESPLSLRDVVQDSDELGDDDLEDEPDPHEMLSLRDLVVAPQAKPHERAELPSVEVKQSQPPARPQSSPSLPPVRPQSSPSLPPKPSGPPARASATSQPPVPRSQVATIPPQRPRLSRPDLGVSVPPRDSAADDLRRRSATRAAVGQEPSSSRNYILGGLALLVLAGIAWRLLGNGPEAEKPKPTPTSTVATIAPPTPVTTPATTSTTTPSATASDTATVETPVTTAPTPPVSTAPVTTSTAKPADTGTKPVATNDTSKPADTGTKKPAAVPVGDSPGSMSDLLDKAGSARRKGDYATARDLYSKVIAMSPSNVEANGGLGDVARAQGDLAGAKASYERALAASPTYSPALLGLADVEWDQGNKPSAIRRYAQIVDRLGDRAPQRAKERANSAQ